MFLEGSLTEYAHMAQQQTDQQRPAHQGAYIGYIQEWDNDTHQVKVIDPLNRSDDDTPMVSAWMPLCTSFAGLANGQNPTNPDVEQYGIRVAPFGGGSRPEPLGGEQVLVLKLNPEIGHDACAFMLYNDGAVPPGGANDIRILGGRLQSGEILYVNPTGTLVYFDIQGNIKIITQALQGAPQGETGNMQAVANGGIMLQTAAEDTAPHAVEQGDIDVRSRRDINEIAQRAIHLTSTNEDITETSGRDITANAQRDITEEAQRDITENCQRNIEMAAGVDITQLATNEFQATAGANMLLAAGVNVEVTAGTDIDVDAAAAINLTSGAIITILATGNIEINSQGLIEILGANVNVGSIGELLQPLITQTFIGLFNAHTHHGVTTGPGVTGVPVVPIVPVFPVVTDVLFAG